MRVITYVSFHVKPKTVNPIKSPGTEAISTYFLVFPDFGQRKKHSETTFLNALQKSLFTFHETQNITYRLTS